MFQLAAVRSNTVRTRPIKAVPDTSRCGIAIPRSSGRLPHYDVTAGYMHVVRPNQRLNEARDRTNP